MHRNKAEQWVLGAQGMGSCLTDTVWVSQCRSSRGLLHVMCS